MQHQQNENEINQLKKLKSMNEKNTIKNIYIFFNLTGFEPVP